MVCRQDVARALLVDDDDRYVRGEATVRTEGERSLEQAMLSVLKSLTHGWSAIIMQTLSWLSVLRLLVPAQKGTWPPMRLKKATLRTPAITFPNRSTPTRLK